MKLTTDTPVSRLSIWNPKWSTRTIKIAAHKVGTHNIITFPKAKSLEGEWYASGSKIREHTITQMPTKSGSMMDIYEINLSEIEPVEWQKVRYLPFDDRTGKYLLGYDI